MSHCNYKQKTQNQNNEKIPKALLSLRMPQSNSYSASRALRTYRQNMPFFYVLSDEGPMLEIRIGSTPTFLYFDLYLYSIVSLLAPQQDNRHIIY